jgi:hypothetical protein|uniref:Uncharacterized protein n=1 Tax=Populus trichocarpa TaxID=3694 RepID=A0A3N7HU86_POPTR
MEGKMNKGDSLLGSTFLEQQLMEIANWNTVFEEDEEEESVEEDCSVIKPSMEGEKKTYKGTLASNNHRESYG